MATQLSTVRSRAGHSVANPQFERRRSTWSEISWRPAAAIASLAVAAAVIGGLVWPTQFVSKKSISVATAPVSVVDEVTPDPAAPQAEVRSGAIDAAAPLGTAEASPGSTASGQNTSSETPSEISAASPAGLRLSSAAVDERAAGSEEPKTAPPVTSEVIAAREPALGETQEAEDDVTHSALFREFLQWRAARVSGVAPTARQKMQPRAIIVCGHQPPSRRPQQQTLSRDPRTRRQLRRHRRARRRWCVHAGLISVTRRAPRLNKWRRHPPPPARHPSSLAFLTS